MKKLRIYGVCLLAICFMLFSCKDSGVLVKPKYSTTVFRGQRGETEVNAFNRKQAEREKSLAEEIEKAEQAVRMLEEQKKMFYCSLYVNSLSRPYFIEHFFFSLH